jgi:hypothetical protein
MCTTSDGMADGDLQKVFTRMLIVGQSAIS